MSTDGADAILDAGGFAVATASGYSIADTFVQCWIRAAGVVVANNNLGLVFRFIDNDHFYIVRNGFSAPSSTVELWRFQLNVAPPNHATLLGFIVRPSHGGWNRFGVEAIGARIKVYWNNEYNAALEGPIIDIVDPAPYLGPGLTGIGTSGNDGTGLAGGLRWGDFAVADGLPETVYVDSSVPIGQGLGTETGPDSGISYALNSPVLQRGGTLKLLNDGGTPYGTGIVTDYTIGHSGKFSADGNEEWPEYEPRGGAVISPGRPNLTIEGVDASPRTILRESQNRPFFRIRNDATYILFREFDFDMAVSLANSGRLVETRADNNLGASVEHSVAVDKVILQLGEPTHNDQYAIDILYDAASVRMRYCEGRVLAGARGNAWMQLGDGTGLTITDVLAEFCVLSGSVLRGIYCRDGPAVGERWRFNHVHYVDLNTAAIIVSCLEIEDGTRVAGTIEHENCLLASRGVNLTEFGTRITANAGAVPGEVQAHHNGYFGIGTPRGAGVVDAGSEVVRNPQFLDEASTYLWPQTAGSPAIVLPSDWRPTALAYLRTSDDAYDGFTLDRGALQVIPFPPPVPPGPWTTITRRQADYCVRVVYASDDPKARAISACLLSARPVTHSKDILFRKYKVSDTSITIWDEEGYFITGGPNSLVDDADGRPDWYGRECTITLQESFGGPDLFTFVGFLIGLKSEAGKATLRLTSRFQRLLMKPFLANDAGKMVDVDGETGVAGDPPTAAAFLSDITPNAAAGCLVETWKFTFLGPTDFSIQGSQTGNDGRGTTGVDFTSDSGRVTVLAADWDITAGAFVAGDECSIKTVYRYAATTTVTAFQETLTNALAGGLTAAEIHPSLATFVGTIVDQRLGPFGLVIDDQMTVLRALEMIALHMLAVAVEFTDARIGMYAYVPTVTTVDTIFCKGTDLIKATIGHTPVYNVFNYEHTYIEKDEEYDGLEGFPDTDADNASFLKYGVKLEAPQQPKLKGFGEGNVSWIRTLARQNYERWAWPRRIFNLDLKVSRMTIEMNELFELQSSNPTVDVIGIEPSKISRTISPSIALSGEFFDASFYLQLEGACGYAFTDQGHLMDNCWVVF